MSKPQHHNHPPICFIRPKDGWMLTKPKLAEELNVTTEWIDERVKRGEIPPPIDKKFAYHAVMMHLGYPDKEGPQFSALDTWKLKQKQATQNA